MRHVRNSVVGLAALLLVGCSFGFAGGGLLAHTVYVDNFDNATSEPTLGQDVTLAIRQAMQSRLGLRSATRQQAGAIVTGKVVRFDPDMPIAFTPTAVPGQPNQVNVTKRQVELAVDVLVTDSTGKTLWEGRGQVVQGVYDAGQQQAGRKLALDNLVKKVIDGIHSGW